MYQDAGDNILHILPDTRTQWHHLTTSSNWSPDLPLGCQQMHLTVCIIAIHSIYSPKLVDNFSVLDIYSHLTFKHVFKHFEALLGYTLDSHGNGQENIIAISIKLIVYIFLRVFLVTCTNKIRIYICYLFILTIIRQRNIILNTQWGVLVIKFQFNI